MQSRRGAVVTPLISLAINQWGSVFVCPPLSPDGLPLWREWMRLEAERRVKVKVWHLVFRDEGQAHHPAALRPSSLATSLLLLRILHKLQQNALAVQQICMLCERSHSITLGPLCIRCDKKQQFMEVCRTWPKFANTFLCYNEQNTTYTFKMLLHKIQRPL